MPTRIIGAHDQELRHILGDKGAGPAAYVAGGLPVTTAVTTGSFPKGTENLYLEVHNLSTATTLQYTLNPWLTVLRTTDGGATFTDYSEEAQGDSISSVVVLDSQDTVANGDALFVGSHLPFRGVAVDVSAANATGSRTLTVSYWNPTTKAWVDSSDTDGTSSSTSLDQDGDVTWTIAAAWGQDNLWDMFTAANEPFKSTYVKPNAANVHVQDLYWTRWEWNGALDSEVELASMLALNRSVAYPMLTAGYRERITFRRGFGAFGAIEYKTDAGTADLIAVVGSGDNNFG